MKKYFTACLVILFLFVSVQNLQASPWAQNQGYFSKTGGKLAYGLKNVAFGWMMMFAESKMPQYHREWEGFCVGISRSVIYTANGLIHIATFPIPVDFPDVGRGVYIPKEEPPSKKKGVPTPPKLTTTNALESKTEKPTAAEPTTAAPAQKSLPVAPPSTQPAQIQKTEPPAQPIQMKGKEPAAVETSKPASKINAEEEVMNDQSPAASKVQKAVPSRPVKEETVVESKIKESEPTEITVTEKPAPPKAAVPAKPAAPSSVYVPATSQRPVSQGNYVPSFAKTDLTAGKVTAPPRAAQNSGPLEPPVVKAAPAVPQSAPVKKSTDSLEEYNQRFALRDELYDDSPSEEQKPAAVRQEMNAQDSEEDLTSILEEADKFSNQNKN
jgi:hypothetical protein